jgi:hypothetical protein
MMPPKQEAQLIELCRRLIDQHRARVVVPPHASESGYWFGGGNLTLGPDGAWYLVGRYRNAGDSRTGLAAGTRGLELAMFRADAPESEFVKIASWSKADLSLPGGNVLSIEGSALRWNQGAPELFVSTEKEGVGYPPRFESYLKPGTGVWSIDRLAAESVEQLATAAVEPYFSSSLPEAIHAKDPFIYKAVHADLLFFCSHPFNWSCSGTSYVPLQREAPSDEQAMLDFFRRGNVWDIAMSRGTCVIDVPKVGAFADQNVQLMFYDGGECVRDLDPHERSVKRPRGYSCEELGGAAYVLERQWSAATRLSRYEPLFVSPHGSGSSRYVDVLVGPDGMHATWQQSQPDRSQPLVMHRLGWPEIEAILT